MSEAEIEKQFGAFLCLHVLVKRMLSGLRRKRTVLIKELGSATGSHYIKSLKADLFCGGGGGLGVTNVSPIIVSVHMVYRVALCFTSCSDSSIISDINISVTRIW